MKKNRISVVFLILALLSLAGSFLIGSGGAGEESIKVVMKDAVLHDVNKVSLFGFMDVNPALVSAFIVTGLFLILGILVKFVLLPRFKLIPSKFQLILENLVAMFRKMAIENSPASNRFLGAYIFSAASYIFVGTIFELFGIQVITTTGSSIAIPAPLSDINAAIAMGFLSFGVILIAGLRVNGIKGGLKTLKDFSLPISMSFRLFGALLSGLLVTELVYYFVSLSFVLPVIVAILFTLLHALIQSYVLIMLTSLFYGEATERHDGVEA